MILKYFVWIKLGYSIDFKIKIVMIFILYFHANVME